MINGERNNNPAGWSGTPAIPGAIAYYTYVLTNDLFQISVTKDAYQQNKSEWSQPIKISTDPTLVRYGNVPSSTNFGPPDNDDWRGFYTPGTDTHMATRISVLLPWRIINIDNEEGEYVDYIFKAFPLNYTIVEGDRPTISNPFSTDISNYPNNNWKDGPFAVGTSEVMYTSVGRKYNNGELKPSKWSFPTRFDGKDTIQSIIEPSTADSFKYDQLGAVSPAAIVLNSRLYKGNTLVPSDVLVKWYKGVVSGPNEIIRDSVIGVSANHVITGTNNEILTVSPLAVDGNQLYTSRNQLVTINYDDTISITDVTDGVSGVALISSSDGYVYKNNLGSKTFTAELYLNGVVVPTGLYTRQWVLGVTNRGTAVTEVVTAAEIASREILKLIVTYLGVQYVKVEDLIDLSDAPSMLIKYNVTQIAPAALITDPTWTTDPVGAFWMRISTDNGVTWTAATKIRGESAAYNGGFQRSAFSNSVTIPVATGVSAGLLPTSAGGWTAQPSTPGVGESTYEVTAFFIKNPANSDVALNSTNWTIDGSWSVAVKKTGTDGTGILGPVGPVGWSPVVSSLVHPSRPNDVIQQVTDWINLGPALIGTKPAVGYYITPGGYSLDFAAATNIKGSAGVFSPSDFWNGPALNFQFSSGGVSFEFIFRVSKNGVVHYRGKAKKTSGGAFIESYTLPSDWVSKMVPETIAYTGMGSLNNPVLVLGRFHNLGYALGGDPFHISIEATVSDYVLKIHYPGGGFIGQVDGSYTTLAFQS